MLYKVTVKSNLNSNGVRLEKGMSVEVASQSYSLLSTLQGKELVNTKRIYRSDGIDTNMSMVRGGIGVVLGPESFARYYNVAAVPLEPKTEASLHFVCLKTLLQRREIRQLRDHLLQACRDHKLLTGTGAAD